MVGNTEAEVVNIVLLDTGGSLSHPYFKNLNCNLLCAEGIENPVDNCGHGTFSLSVIVRTMRAFPNINYKITSIKVSEDSTIDIRILNKGLQYCYEELNPDVIYIGSCNCAYNADMARRLNQLANNGTIIVVPSGNYAFHEPTYPSCFETTICCGLTNEDGTICDTVNSYKSDVFVKCKNSLGILSAESAKMLKVTRNSEGMGYLSATSFSAAEFTAYASIIKAYRREINVYWLRKIIYENCENLVLADFESLLFAVLKAKQYQNDKASIDVRYIMLEHPKNMNIKGNWEISIHTVDGNLDVQSGILDFELYQDRYMKNKVYQEKINYKGGYGNIFIMDQKFEPGIYMMRIGNRTCGIESVMSMMIMRPGKPNVVFEDNMVSVYTEVKDAIILYTEDGKLPVATADGSAVATTKIYESPIKRTKNIMVFCTFCNGIFSEPVILNESDGGRYNE